VDHELRSVIETWTPRSDSTPRDADWFPSVFDEAPFGIAAIDMTGHWVRVNPACARLHGRTVEEMTGNYALNSNNQPENRPDYERNLEMAREGEMDRYRAEHRIVRPDGSVKWAMIHATVVHDTDGHPAYALVEYHETTDVRQMAEAARASTEAYQLTLETAPIAIYSVDFEGHVVDWNPMAEQVFGWTADEVLGRSIPLVPQELMDGAADGLARLTAGETIPVEEAILLHKDGRRLTVVTSATVTHTPEGEPERIVAFAFDITEQRRTQNELREQELRMRTILSKISETVTVVGADGRVRFSTGQYADVLGYPTEFWNDLDVLSLVHPDDLEAAQKRFEELLETSGAELTDVYRMRNSEGDWMPIEVAGINLLDDPDVGGLVLTTRNLSEIRRAKELLADEARILEMIATNAPMDEVLTNIARMVERNSHGGTSSIILLEPDRRMRVAAGPNVPEALFDVVDRRRPFGIFARGIEARRPVIVENVEFTDVADAEVIDASKALGVISGWVTPIFDASTDEAIGLVGTYFSKPDPPTADGLAVSELASHLTAIALDRTRAQEALHHQAHHDSLTGLPNRTLVVKRLEQLLSEPKVVVEPVAVMFLDLDRFKVINDSLGHRAGDALLGMFADRLRGLVRPGDLVGRFSADEFVVLVADEPSESAVSAIANRIEVALSEPFSLDEGDIYLSVSTGVAFATFEDDTAHRLLEQASAAMVEAKRHGRDRLEVFDHAMRAKARERLQLERDLRTALERSEFVLHYQPKIDLETRRMVGVEALLRWQHPERGLIFPDEFIPVAEETGLIVRIGRWVLEEAVQEARMWVDAVPDLDHFVLAVNFSPRQMGAADLINNLGRVLLKYGWPPERLSVEVTETILIDDAEGSLEVVQQLADLGVKLTIDDFGTGYSSLSYLHRFPVDIVKIDRAFVSELRPDGKGSAVAAAIMQMARALGVITCAEGVETGDQLAGLTALGCDWAQGFIFSRAVPSGEITRMLVDGSVFDTAY
jgi:diguanylate cyclase (GGDEF)-like protein/PAS domain S-box-containing protein